MEGKSENYLSFHHKSDEDKSLFEADLCLVIHVTWGNNVAQPILWAPRQANYLQVPVMDKLKAKFQTRA